MRGLVKLPSYENLERAYDQLLHTRPSQPSVEELALFSQWARIDPRLAEIWVSYVAKAWCSMDPMRLRSALLSLPWPRAAAALLEFTHVLVQASQPINKNLFDRWKQLVETDFSIDSFEQFFIGLRKIGGTLMLEDAQYSSEEFRKWGFLSRENLVPKGKGPALSASTREEVLRSLIQKSNRIRTLDYWNAVGRCISPRQAERDLRSSPWLRSRGRTKGRYFSVKPNFVRSP